jgi:translation initiation factor IF-2
MGVMATINQTIDHDTAVLVVEELGHVPVADTQNNAEETLAAHTQNVELEGEKSTRPPVVTIMGHVDHGKTSLLDYIRRTKVASGEAGGITQHLGAYHVKTSKGVITFLDTPGHAAFKALRERGAAAADIAILVIAADEGVMPQTLEALEAIQATSTPYVVAITKIDKNNADQERAKSSMLEHGIYLEGLGGEIPYTSISSKTGEGISELLDLVLLAADLAELTGDPELPAEGYVLEASQDPKRGASATLIVKDGTLSTGSFVVAGGAYAPVRFIEDFRGSRIAAAGPSEPARIAGFSALPAAGALFSISPTKKGAEARAKAEAAAADERFTLAEGVVEIPLVVKADVAGSIDAIRLELGKATHERAAIHIIATGVGAVSENDVKTAKAAGALIIAFTVGTESLAADLALRENVAIESFSIIYKLSERIEELLAEKAPKIAVDKELGRAKVVATFSTSAKKQVIGANLSSGAFSLGADVKIVRDHEIVARGTITNLQQARANVKEIRTEGNFGIEVEAKENAAPGDELITFTTTES